MPAFGAVSIEPRSVLKVEIITTSDTNATPARPTSSCAASAATSGERAIWSMGSRYRYAALTSK